MRDRETDKWNKTHTKSMVKRNKKRLAKLFGMFQAPKRYIGAT